MTENVASQWAVELNGLAKAFGACVANRDVTFQVGKGSVHAIVGENGAGKSTAMKMLYGLIRPDSGEMRVHGQPVVWRSPKDAIAHGIGMVHQHFMLAEPVSGLDNILVGAEPQRAWTRFLPSVLRPIDRDAARARLLELAKKYHLAVDLDVPVQELPVGAQQRLEILKLLYREVDILILDEPTAVLTPTETTDLFENLQRLRAEGKTILIITHKLGEVLAFADRATVLRQGAVVATIETKGTTAEDLATLMVGRAVELTVKAPAPPRLGETRLKLQNVTVGQAGQKSRLKDLSLELRAGEILGIAGVEGNGQSDLLRLLTDPQFYFGGARPLAVGACELLGKDARHLAPRAVRDLGVGHVPEDRHRQALIFGFDLAENFLLGHERETRFSKRGLVARASLTNAVTAAIKDFDVRPADPNAHAEDLSGGNQQKLVIAREMAHAPKLLIAAQPTRGVDVGSIEFIHKRILEERANGTAVLLVSSSLDEIRALSDRILVLFEGQVTGSYRRGEADEATLGKAMGGATHG